MRSLVGHFKGIVILVFLFLSAVVAQVQITANSDGCLEVNGKTIYIYGPHLLDQIPLFYDEENLVPSYENKVLEQYEPLYSSPVNPLDEDFLDQEQNLNVLFLERDRPDPTGIILNRQHIWYKQPIGYYNFAKGEEGIFQWGLYTKKDGGEDAHAFICAPSNRFTLPIPTVERYLKFLNDDGGGSDNLASGP